MKTGALLHYAVEAGAILGAPTRGKGSVIALWQAIGAAFQVADDILDVEADEEALGKRAGKDAARNKATLVAALGLKAPASAAMRWRRRPSPRSVLSRMRRQPS